MGINEKVESVKKLIYEWKNFIITLNAEIKGAHFEQVGFVSQLEKKMFDAMVSKPIDSKLHRVERLTNRIYRKILISYFEHRVDSKKIGFSRSLIHGDFHLNNVLIDDYKQFKIVDFENIYYGAPEVELAYLYCQMWAILHNQKQAIVDIDHYIDVNIVPGMLNKEFYESAKSILLFSICHNRSQFEPGRRRISLAEYRKIRKTAFVFLSGRRPVPGISYK